MASNDMVEALHVRIQALEIKNDALQTKIEALELLNRNLQYLSDVKRQLGITSTPSELTAGIETAQEIETEDEEDDRPATGKKRGRKPKPSATLITQMQQPLEATLRDMLSGERFNRATYRALTGILLCLFENKTATVSMLHEYIGGARVTVVRHTALLKRVGLIRYEGSRKKGHYALTDNGRELYLRVREQAGA